MATETDSAQALLEKSGIVTSSRSIQPGQTKEDLVDITLAPPCEIQGEGAAKLSIALAAHLESRGIPVSFVTAAVSDSLADKLFATHNIPVSNLANFHDDPAAGDKLQRPINQLTIAVPDGVDRAAYIQRVTHEIAAFTRKATATIPYHGHDDSHPNDHLGYEANGAPIASTNIKRTQEIQDRALSLVQSENCPSASLHGHFSRFAQLIKDQSVTRG